MGVDWRVPLDAAVGRIQPGQAVQGNLDSTLVFAPWEAIETATRAVVEAGRAAPGHIFNLGHGVLPDTDPDVLTRLVELVHSLDG
jgi:uroporphyrinogen decarboxylase